MDPSLSILMSALIVNLSGNTHLQPLLSCSAVACYTLVSCIHCVYCRLCCTTLHLHTYYVPTSLDPLIPDSQLSLVAWYCTTVQLLLIHITHPSWGVSLGLAFQIPISRCVGHIMYLGLLIYILQIPLLA